MESKEKLIHFMYVPFTGLGLYNGFRGNRWLRNRIKVFKEYTCRSLKAQTNQNFIIWVSWRSQERNNIQVLKLHDWMDEYFGKGKTVFTYNGVCFWDDKYKDCEARERLVTSLHHTMAELMDYITEETVLMTIQPSDDCYHKQMVDEIQYFFNRSECNAIGYRKGYIMNYATKELSEYNPTTNPPFFTIKFPKDIFIEPKKHMDYTGPYKSHEYILDFTDYYKHQARGFLVGCHGENISTYYDHPFKGLSVPDYRLEDFGLEEAPNLKFKVGWKRWILKKLPHKIRRKIRYCHERIYNFLRS